MALLARLDKSGRWVQCGVRDCGTELARIVDALEEGGPLSVLSAVYGYDDAADQNPLRPTVPVDLRRWVWFSEAWAPRADGVWAMIRRAQRRLEKWKALDRQPATLSGEGYGHERLRPRRIVIPEVTERDDPNAPRGPVGYAIYALPVDAVCVRCGSRQTLRADVLHANPGYTPRPGAKRCAAPMCGGVALPDSRFCDTHAPPGPRRKSPGLPGWAYVLQQDHHWRTELMFREAKIRRLPLGLDPLTP